MFLLRTLLNHIPEQWSFLIRPNASYDGNPLRSDQKTFPAETLPEGQLFMPPIDEEATINFLFRDGYVPEWINVSVYVTDERYVTLS